LALNCENPYRIGHEEKKVKVNRRDIITFWLYERLGTSARIAGGGGQQRKEGDRDTSYRCYGRRYGRRYSVLVQGGY